MALRVRPSKIDRSAATPEKKAHPLFWLLVLVALLVIGWSVYNRYASRGALAATRSDDASHASRPVDRAVDAQPLRPGRTSRTPRP